MCYVLKPLHAESTNLLRNHRTWEYKSHKRGEQSLFFLLFFSKVQPSCPVHYRELIHSDSGYNHLSLFQQLLHSILLLLSKVPVGDCLWHLDHLDSLKLPTNLWDQIHENVTFRRQEEEKSSLNYALFSVLLSVRFCWTLVRQWAQIQSLLCTVEEGQVV